MRSICRTEHPHRGGTCQCRFLHNPQGESTLSLWEHAGMAPCCKARRRHAAGRPRPRLLRFGADPCSDDGSHPKAKRKAEERTVEDGEPQGDSHSSAEEATDPKRLVHRASSNGILVNSVIQRLLHEWLVPSGKTRLWAGTGRIAFEYFPRMQRTVHSHKVFAMAV